MVTGVTGSTMTANVIGAAAIPTALKDGPPAKSDRRSNKPIMEKRRRARINNCLNELKTLILDATKKDPARHSKLEKADILEKTVKHLQELQRQQAAMQQAADPKIINKFKAGFTECANEVSRFPGLEATVKRRLLQHLSGCINSVKCDLHQHHRQLTAAHAQQLHAQLLPSPPSSPEQETHNHHHHQQQQQQQQHNNNNNNCATVTTQIQQTVNGYFLPNGQKVIPTKLPNGNIALVLPHHIQQQQQQQKQQQQQQQQQLLLSIPTRTASTSSASSHNSSLYERNMTSSPTCSMGAYAPPSPANSYDAAIDCKSTPHHAVTMTLAHHQQQQQQQVLIQQQQQQQQQLQLLLLQKQQQQQQQQHHHQFEQNQQPLSLVIKKQHHQQQQQQQLIKQEEEQPWRPW